MKKAIVCIFFCMLVIPNFIASAEYIDIEKAPTNYNDDVPIWKEGDSWTYTISDFWVNYSVEGIGLSMEGRIDDFQWTVSDTSGSTYTVDLTGKVTASYNASLPLGAQILNVEGTIKPPWNSITGTIIFSQSNLEIIDFDAEIKGLTAIKIHPIPIKFLIPFKITADVDLSTSFPLLNFPLYIPKFWDMPAMIVTVDATFGGLFGLFKIPMTLSIPYNWVPLAFTCLWKGDITVGAGTYDAWRIKPLLFGFFEYYYASLVGNLIKFDVNMARGGAQGELIATNYK